MRRFFWKLDRRACFKTPEELAAEEAAKAAAAAAGVASGGGAAPKADGRTERALANDVSRHEAELARLKTHTGLDETLEDEGDDEEDEEEESDDGDGVDSILAHGISLGGDDEEEEAEQPAPKKKGKKRQAA